MNTKEARLAALDRVAKKDPDYWKDTEYRIANERWLERSFRVAVKVLLHLKRNKITKRELAERIGVSPQYVGRILKGKENFTFETIDKLERATGLVLMEIPREEKWRPRYTYDHVKEETDYALTATNIQFNLALEKHYTLKQAVAKEAVQQEFTTVHQYTETDILACA